MGPVPLSVTIPTAQGPARTAASAQSAPNNIGTGPSFSTTAGLPTLSENTAPGATNNLGHVPVQDRPPGATSGNSAPVNSGGPVLSNPQLPFSPEHHVQPHYTRNYQPFYQPHSYPYPYGAPANPMTYTSPIQSPVAASIYNPLVGHTPLTAHPNTSSPPYYPEYTSPIQASTHMNYFFSPPPIYAHPISPNQAHAPHPSNSIHGMIQRLHPYPIQSTQSSHHHGLTHASFQPPTSIPVDRRANPHQRLHLYSQPTVNIKGHAAVPIVAPNPVASDGARCSPRGHGTSGVRAPVTHERPRLRDLELKDMIGRIVELSCDQQGSRLLQRRLDFASTEQLEQIIDEILPSPNDTTVLLRLMRDVFANYVVQKLFEHGSQTQRTRLLEAMQGHIPALSLEMYGCRVVQRALDDVTPAQQTIIVAELLPSFIETVKDSNGNHVIQKMISSVLGEHPTFVRTFKGHLWELATHPYGCRALQRCVEHIDDTEIRPLMQEIHGIAPELMQDSFGNYVIQFILERGSAADRHQLIQEGILNGNLLSAAKHKFASNVVEKAFMFGTHEEKAALINAIVNPNPEDGISPLVLMMRDPYANYVLQTAIKYTPAGPSFDLLVEHVKPQLISMRRYVAPFSKHLNAIERLLRERDVDPRVSFD